MPNKGEQPTEKLTERPPVRFTPTQMETLRKRAADAGLDVATYVRTAALGLKLARGRKVLTIDGVRYSRIMSALGATMSVLIRLEDLFAFEDVARPEDWQASAAEMHKTSQLMLSLSPDADPDDDRIEAAERDL